MLHLMLFFFSSRRRHTSFSRDWSSDVCSSDLVTWPISRELLAHGYVDGCAGPGDVHIDRDGRHVILQLATPEGIVVALPARPVSHVLICSHDQAPIGREPVDVDSAIELILGGAR